MAPRNDRLDLTAVAPGDCTTGDYGGSGCFCWCGSVWQWRAVTTVAYTLSITIREVSISFQLGAQIELRLLLWCRSLWPVPLHCPFLSPSDPLGDLLPRQSCALWKRWHNWFIILWMLWMRGRVRTGATTFTTLWAIFWLGSRSLRCPDGFLIYIFSRFLEGCLQCAKQAIKGTTTRMRWWVFDSIHVSLKCQATRWSIFVLTAGNQTAWRSSHISPNSVATLKGFLR